MDLQVGTAPPSGEGFLAFEDGDDVELATAGQGGFHIFVSYAARGFVPFGLEVRRAVNFADTGEEIRANPERVNLLQPAVPGDDTYCTLRTAQFAILCPTILGRVRDEDLEIVVDIEDVNGESMRVTRYARAVCPTEGEYVEQCFEICDGIPVE